MVDALVSGASVERRAGSSPVLGTISTRRQSSIASSLFLVFIYGNLRRTKSAPECACYGLVWASEASGAAVRGLFVYVVEFPGVIFYEEAFEAEGVDHFSFVVEYLQECVASAYSVWPISV